MNSAGQQNTRFTIQKSVAFLYSKNEISERESKKKKKTFIITLKIKYFGINLTKEVEDLYPENY